MPRGREMAFLLVVGACGGRVEDDQPGGSNGGGGTLPDASGSGGFAGDEPWDATVDGAPASVEQLCAMDGTPVPSPCTQAEMNSRLGRRWWQCSGEFAFDTPDAVGLEFTTDGHWYLLTLDPSGAVVRGTGASYEGTWDMYGPGSMNGPCSIQVNIYKSGMLGSFPIFAKQPTKVNLNTGGDGGKPVYVGIP